MFTFDLIIPWLTFAAVLGALLYVQRWIHRHLFGMGYLIGKEKHAATLFYYLLLMPGVILHEFSHYMMAGVFGIGHKKFELFPHAQDDGSLEMGFVELEEVKNPVFAAFIGIAPLLSGLAVVVYVSNSILNLPQLFTSFQTGDLTVIAAALQMLVYKPDFLLWTYIAFAVANAMMPSSEDWRGWWLVGAGVGVGLLLMTILGFQVAVVDWLTGPIPRALYSLTAVFGTVLILDCCAVVLIWTIETILERVTGHKVEYAPLLPGVTNKAIQSTRPTIRSVYELRLPLPQPPGKVAKPAPARLPGGTDRPAVASGQRPAIGAGNKPAFGQIARPALPASTSKAPATIGGPPALARSNLPGTPAPKPGTPAARPANAPFGAPPRSKPAGNDEDVIDADVVEEEDDDVQYVDDPDVN